MTSRFCLSRSNLRHAGILALGMVTTSNATTSTPARCDSSNNNNDSIWDTLFPKDRNGNVYWDKAGQQVTDSLFWDKIAKSSGKTIQGALDSGIPTHLTYGFFSGYCSGIALKKVGRAVSVVLGLGFVALQTLNYYGYVKVDHGQLQKDFSDFLDLNKDGKVDAEDGKAIYNHTLKVLEFNLPAGGGFAAGFLGGLRTG